MKLKNKIAIITGGSGGIGKTIADFFVREGAQVIAFSRADCDVADARAVMRMVQRVAKKYGRIDILVNAAGIQAPIGLFVKNDLEDWEKNIAVNLFGTVAMCKAVLPFMTKRRGGLGSRGSIINFSGGGATSSRPNFSAYAVAKTGVVKFTEILADELRPLHIKVNAIAPGAVNTFMLTEVLAVGTAAGKQELAAAKKRFKEGGVLPEVPAALAVFLASRDSDGLTGRLISAPWDDWKKWNAKAIKNIVATDALTLRRVPVKIKKS